MAAEVIAGRYLLCDPIGSGGSGTVWRAYDRDRQRYCAAKLLRQRDAGELLRFAREQAVRLDHPNIVSPYAWAADDGMVLIASDLINGGSLQVLLGDYGALAERTVVEILDQVLSALQAVHTAELIHRDVKPGNLLLKATGDGPLQVMLADFGLTISRRDARLTATGMVIGTPGYLPPEVLVGRVSPEPAHDMYAVGRLALALLTGQEVAAAVQDDVPIADSSLREVVRGLLRADPTERPVSAQAARTMLRSAERSAIPHNRDGDAISVLDQLPPLPAGWGDVGEIPAHRDSAAPQPVKGRPTVVEMVEPEPAAQTVPVGPFGRVAPVSPAPTGRRRFRAWRAVGAGTGLLLLVIAGFLFTRSIGSGPDDVNGPPNSSVTAPPTGTAAATVPSTPNPIITDADLRAGDACGWQLEGDRRTTADGDLVCAVDAGAYRWVVAPG